jgi:LmbE family N-acetylglucosaminyl deacetylase/tetratricopeptide (TPR) repeat protein
VRLPVLATAAAILVGALAPAAARDTVAQRKEEARLAADRGALGDAVGRYEDIVRSTPRDIDARLRLAELYVRTHDLDHSISAYRDLLTLDPANLRGKMGLARVLRWSHRYADAEQLYKEILADAPGDGDAIEGLAQTYALAGDFPSALALLDRGLSLSPEDTDLLALKGTVLAWQGRFAEGLGWTERALALKPRSASLERDLGDILMWKGDYTRAAEAYHRALELEAHSVGTALDLAAAYEAAGKTDLAENVVKDALRRAPDDRKALERLQELRRGPRQDASRPWRVGLQAASHAGLPLVLAWVFYRRRRLVRRRPRLYRLTYQTLLPGLALVWVVAFVTELAAGSQLPLQIVEPLIFASLALALLSGDWGAGPAVDINARAVLAVGAHPDDIEIGAGGLLLRLKEEGAKVYGLVMSQGEMGAPGGSRRADEARAAARVLGLDDLWILDFPDTHLRDCIPAMRDAVEAKLAELGIDLVITHSFREIHGDHVAVFEAAKEAARRCSLMCFETVSTPPEFVPNYFADVTAFFDDKIKAIAAHRSQGDKAYMDPELVRGRAAHRGLQVNVPYAEAFWVYRWVR